jgi:hypothetical protein
MRFAIPKEQMDKPYQTIHTESIYDLKILENIENGNYLPFLGTKAIQMFQWINGDSGTKTDTELYAHRSLNDLIYALQYFYGITFYEDQNHLVTEELTAEELHLLVEYSEFIFKKHYFGLTREEFEDIYRKEQLEQEIFEQQEALFID